jgi:hypothetical protein
MSKKRKSPLPDGMSPKLPPRRKGLSEIFNAGLDTTLLPNAPGGGKKRLKTTSRYADLGKPLPKRERVASGRSKASRERMAILKAIKKPVGLDPSIKTNGKKQQPLKMRTGGIRERAGM